MATIVKVGENKYINADKIILIKEADRKGYYEFVCSERYTIILREEEKNDFFKQLEMLNK